MARTPVPYFDGQVEVETDWQPDDPEIFAPNTLKRDEDGDPIKEALFSNHNAQLLLECDGQSLVGRSDLERGVAKKIDVVAPLKLEDDKLTLGGSSGGGNAYTASTTPPLSPHPGDLWYDLSNGTLAIRVDDGTGAQWIKIAPGAGGGSGGTGGGIAEAPSDNKGYGRVNATWAPVLLITGDVLDGGNF